MADLSVVGLAKIEVHLCRERQTTAAVNGRSKKLENLKGRGLRCCTIKVCNGAARDEEAVVHIRVRAAHDASHLCEDLYLGQSEDRCNLVGVRIRVGGHCQPLTYQHACGPFKILLTPFGRRLS